MKKIPAKKKYQQFSAPKITEISVIEGMEYSEQWGHRVVTGRFIIRNVYIMIITCL